MPRFPEFGRMMPAHETYDVIVIGAGAGGMTAAAVAAAEGLRVLVIEKTAFVGGTTAWSGGMGMKVDAQARVLREDGTPIVGLYACGNDMGSIMRNYPGPGITLGPALTFGYIAGRHLAEGAMVMPAAGVSASV